MVPESYDSQARPRVAERLSEDEYLVTSMGKRKELGYNDGDRAHETLAGCWLPSDGDRSWSLGEECPHTPRPTLYAVIASATRPPSRSEALARFGLGRAPSALLPCPVR
jgi:hypothetical protein